MPEECYFGTYANFETDTKRNAAALLGADNLVGDKFEIVFQKKDDVSFAWMKNRFGGMVGYFDPALSRKLQVFAARGWKLCALLSFVAFTEKPDPGHYWGQAALICYDPKHEQTFVTFIDAVAKKLMDGIRPEIDLGSQGVDHVLESDGTWMPKKTIPLPSQNKGTAIMKSRRKPSEKMIEQGRRGNKGCYIASWAFLLLIVALIIFGLRACGVF